jgi:regulator of sigma D
MNKKLFKIAIIFSAIALIFWHCQEPDTNPPKINLLGDDTVRLVLNSTYNDPGATASDPEEGNLTQHILITSEVDYTTTGTYKIYYTVTDEGGNKAEVSRHMIIYNQAEVYNGIYDAAGIVSTGSSIAYNDLLQADAQQNHYLRSKNFLNDSVEILIFARNDSVYIEKQKIIYQQDTFNIHTPTYLTINSTGFHLMFNLTKPDSSVVTLYNIKYDYASPL